ncbi:amidase [Tatumella morbirosei]|nr:amidase [Tatumella morbirosei]
MKQNTPLEQAIASVQQRNPELKAFVWLPEHYPETPGGLPLSGIPVAVKDLIDTKDMPTGYGCRLFQGHLPAEDAKIVRQLKAAGATIFGKTATTEFAWRHPAATVNPWNYRHTPGGSSSGSAAAVAAGIVNIALGTQTVGSVIRPAAYCGVVGFKPTYGRVSVEGIQPLAGSLDHTGFIVSDCYYASLCQQVIVDNQTTVSHPVPVKPRRVRLYMPAHWQSADEELKSWFSGIIGWLNEQGIECRPLEAADKAPEWLAALDTILAYEACQGLSAKIGADLSAVGKATSALIQQGSEISSEVYQQAITFMQQCRRQRDDYFHDSDVILSLAAPSVAPQGLSSTGDASFCAPWSFLGLPAMTLPGGISAQRLPIGLQLIGHSMKESDLISMACWFESRLPRIKAPLIGGGSDRDKS